MKHNGLEIAQMIHAYTGNFLLLLKGPDGHLLNYTVSPKDAPAEWFDLQRKCGGGEVLIKHYKPMALPDNVLEWT